MVRPLNDAEHTFLDLLLDREEIDASGLTPDAALRQRIHAQPLLQWKALHVRHHKGLSCEADAIPVGIPSRFCLPVPNKRSPLVDE